MALCPGVWTLSTTGSKDKAAGDERPKQRAATSVRSPLSMGRPAPLKSDPVPREPWETIATHLLKLPMTREGNNYFLVTIDHFSRFSILVPLKDKTAKSVATAVIDEVVCKFNSPSVLISDNGEEFNNQNLNEICSKFHIK